MLQLLHYRNAYLSVKFPSLYTVTTCPKCRIPWREGRRGWAALRCYSEMTNHNVQYNARAFFTVDVLVHVDAPVREVVLHGKRYTLPASPPANLSCVHFYPQSSSPTSLSPTSRHFSFLPHEPSPSVPGISQLVSTRLIQMNQGLSDVSRKTNWILKIKKRRPGGPKPTDLETYDRAARCFGCSCFFFACLL